VRPWLSPAQFVLFVMAPLGLMGWPFTADWERPSPLTVPFEDVGRVEDYRTLAAMGIVVWSNAQVTIDAAKAGGAHCAFLGNGIPMSFPPRTQDKTVDVAWLTDNRWAPFARDLAAQVDGSVDAIESLDHPEVLKRLERAKILLYPARIEGESRITREARAMGTVPVVPRGNPIATKLGEADGVLAVDELASIPAAISALLADPERLTKLSERASATARADAAWEPYVARVKEAVESLPGPDPFLGARAAMGAAVRERVERLTADAERVAELEAELVRVNDRNVELEVELEAVRERKDLVEAQLQGLLSRRWVRWSTAASDFARRDR
jgi:hypothetical protein